MIPPPRPAGRGTLLDALTEPAQLLVDAAHTDAGAAVNEALDVAAAITADHLGRPCDTDTLYLAAAGLALVLAAAVDPDYPLDELLAWTRDKPVYRYARREGLTHHEAIGWVLICAEDPEAAAHAAAANAAHHAAARRARAPDPATAATRPPSPPGRRLHVVRPDPR